MERQIPHHSLEWKKDREMGSERLLMSGSRRDVLTALSLVCANPKQLYTQNAGLKMCFKKYAGIFTK